MAKKIDHLLNEAVRSHRAGDTAQAERGYRHALKRQPYHAPATLGYAQLLRETGRGQQAIEQLERAARARPRSADLLLGFAEELVRIGRAPEAIRRFDAALEQQPDNPRLHAALGDFYMARFYPERAIDAYRRAAELAPDDASMHGKLADALFDHGLMSDAAASYERALEREPSNLDWQTNLATALRIEGRHDEAMERFASIEDSHRDIPEALAGQAEILESQGRNDAAEELLRGAIDRGVVNATVAASFARVCRTRRSFKEAIEYVRRVIRTPGLPTRDKAMLFFALGATHEAAKDYESAFTCYRNANELAPKTFNREEHASLVSKLIDIFSADRLSEYPRSSIESQLPVFIVGMPRSGTSLVEQILACHEQVYGAGELPDLTNLVIMMHERVGLDRPYPDLMPDVTQAMIDALARERIDRLRAFDAAVERVTDKMPHNFSHLGLINLLFPGARIIHCRRDPLDTLVSCYTTQLPLHHSYKSDLEDLAFAYGQYQRLMTHWRSAIDLPILEVRYEEMVSDPETMTRRLLEFLDLEWDEACLRFHESKRITHTASVDQVRRPVYQTSRGRAQRFHAHLEPLRAGLERWGVDPAPIRESV